MKKFFRYILKSYKIILLIFIFLTANIPFGFVRVLVDKWNEYNIVDQLYWAERDTNVIDSFKPRVTQAAEVAIDTTILDGTDEYGPSPSIVFTNDQTGYSFFVDATTQDLVYRKTTNGGTNWTTLGIVDSAITGWTQVAVWYDQWTPGDDSGTKIHIAAADDASADIFYTYLDTNGDTLKGSMVTAVSGTTTMTESTDGPPGITKGAGGALFVSGNFTNTAGGKVSKSSNSGDTWSDITPSSWSSVAIDQIQLLPLETDDDIIAIKAQTADNTIRSRVYDEAGDAWDGAWSASIASLTENTTYDQWFSATVRKSTGDIYLSFANQTANAANDLAFWKYTDSGRSWIQGADVMTNNSNSIAPVPLINDNNGEIYVAYLRGTLAATMGVYYKKSTDNGATWSAEQEQLAASVTDDYKSLRGNLLSDSRLFVAYYDDDDNALYGSTIMSQGQSVEAYINDAIIDASDEFSASPSLVFTNDQTGYEFYMKSDTHLDSTDEYGPSPGVVFTSATVGYSFFIDAPSQDLGYRKTIDGGASWSGTYIINTAVTGWTAVSVWYDQWTPGDTSGTLIHIAASDDASDDIYYTYLDTSDDSLRSGGVVVTVTGTAITEAADGPPSITKGASGNLFICGNFTTTAGGKVGKSTDGGDNWSDITPSGWSTLAVDQIQLLPLATDNDVIAIRADTANNEMDYQIYDEVGDSWAGSWTSIAAMVDNATYDQWFSATIKKSTGDVYLTFTGNLSVATGDIEFWTFTDSGRSWTKGTDVYSNNATILAPVPLVEEDTGNIYVAYLRGTLAGSMRVYYKSSTDGGVSWSSESSTISPTTTDDFKSLRGNLLSNDQLYVIWHNDDTNTIKGNSIFSPLTYDNPVTGIGRVVYSKTNDGGVTWSIPLSIASTQGTTSLAIWYDRWTPGDTTGTKIHVAFSDDIVDDVYYSSFDTNGDIFKPPILTTLTGTAVTESGDGPPSITKGVGGNLFICANFTTTAGGKVSKSSNSGDTWSDITPSSWSSVAIDQIQLLPLETDDDIIAIKAQTADNTIRSRVYDEAGDAWDGAWSASIASLTENTTYDQWFSATVRKSTGDIYLSFANQTANAANDLAFWNYTDSGRSWIQGADVMTNDATVIAPTPLIDENSGDLYVAYLRGTLAATMGVYYKKSTDNGATWGSESANLGSGIVDDHKVLRSNLGSTDRLYVVWHNDDLNDIMGHTVADIWGYEQAAYRWFENANSTDVGVALEAQDTAAELTSAGEDFRLRMLLHNTGQIPLRGEDLKLQFAEMSGSCDTAFSGETYADVTDATAIAYNDNATPTDGASLTANVNDPTHSGHTIANQSYEELNNHTNSVALIPSGQDGKWDFSLIDNSAPENTTYCFRIVRADNSLLESYSVIPELTVASSSLTMNMSLSDATIGFGACSSSVTRYATGDGTGSGSEISAHTIDVTSSGSTGYTLYVQGDTLTRTPGGQTISAIGGTPAASSLGTEQFGIRATVSGGTGTVSSPYNHASNYGYAATSTTQSTIGSASAASTDTYTLRYLCNISAATEAGNYSTTLTYTAVGSF